MQFTIATVALFASTVLALPAPQAGAPARATVSFINDQTGAHAAIVAPLDGTPINLYNYLIGSPVGVPTQVFASSAQLIAYPQNVNCAITGLSGTSFGRLTATSTYTRLNPLVKDSVALVNLSGATLSCRPK